MTMNRASTGQEKVKSHLVTEEMMVDGRPWTRVDSHRLIGLVQDGLKWEIPVEMVGACWTTSGRATDFNRAGQILKVGGAT